eukprot:scaffold12161_cov81-Skeletonema_dohrnii-CCMP3373.AAC.11
MSSKCDVHIDKHDLVSIYTRPKRFHTNRGELFYSISRDNVSVCDDGHLKVPNLDALKVKLKSFRRIGDRDGELVGSGKGVIEGFGVGSRVDCLDGFGGGEETAG